MTQPTKRIVDGVELKAVGIATALIVVLGGALLAFAGIAGLALRVFQAASGG